MMLAINVADHEQTWIKVNARVDLAIAPVVSVLNRIEGLQTLDSGEGVGGGGKPAHVYFNYGDWRTLGELLFERIAPALHERLGDSAMISVEIFSGSDPMGELSFEKEATSGIASVLSELLYERP